MADEKTTLDNMAHAVGQVKRLEKQLADAKEKVIDLEKQLEGAKLILKDTIGQWNEEEVTA